MGLLSFACLTGGAQSLADASADRNDRSQALIAEYIDRWRLFYPSDAFANGDVPSAPRFEDFSAERVATWLEYNAQVNRVASDIERTAPPAGATRIDLRQLVHQTADELGNWEEDKPLTSQPGWYAERVSQALTYLLVREQLAPEQLSTALIARLNGVSRLCKVARNSLKAGNALRTERAMQILAGTRNFYEQQLPILVRDLPNKSAIETAAEAAIQAIGSLELFLAESLLPQARDPVAMGAKTYGAKLTRRSGGSFDPPGLLQAAGEEMVEVRALMDKEAMRWRDAMEVAAPLKDGESLLSLALEAMENDRQGDAESFLDEFVTLTRAAEQFVEDKELATVPKPTTLYIDLSPDHFSGAAVGGVYPSGPFSPDAQTLFFLPSIPDSASAAAKEGFYRSFNTHFNTMIISHEMFPGHYLQYKVAGQHAPQIRTLFPNGAYVEGWGSFVEAFMLDEGWANNSPLTRLAHLRKRLENATRAYVSVQVHTGGWNEEQVRRFAVEEGLLAPQFADNLWQRVVHSPLQITDYFRGFRRFQKLYENKPANRSKQQWVDAVLQAGPVPITVLETLLTQSGEASLTSR